MNRVIMRAATTFPLLIVTFCLHVVVPCMYCSGQDSVAKSSVGELATESVNESATASFFDRLQRVPLCEVAPDEPTALLNLRGRVLDDSGKPVIDAVVVVSSSAILTKFAKDNDEDSQSDVIARTRTNAEGEYSFSAVRCPVSREQIRSSQSRSTRIGHLIASSSSGNMNWSTLESDGPLPGAIEASIDIALGESHKVSGVVLDANERPLAKVAVRMSLLIEFGEQTLRRSLELCPALGFDTESDAEGRFQFSQLPGGAVAFLRLSHADYFQTAASIRTSPDARAPSQNFTSPAIEVVQLSPATLHLDQRLMVQGKVINRKQEPLAGAIIRAAFSDAGDVQSDAEGEFAIAISRTWFEHRAKNATVAPLSILWPEGAAYVTGQPSLSSQQISAGDPVTIVAQDAIVLRGQVLSADDHQPVANLPLKIDSLKDRKVNSEIEVQTDDAGRFSVVLNEGRWLISCGPLEGFDLPAINSLRNADKGINPQSQRIVDLVAEGDHSAVSILIDRTPPLVVHVVDSQGQAVAGAKVAFLVTDSSSQFQGQTKFQNRVPAGMTDAAGNFEVRLPSVFQENWIVAASSPAAAASSFGRTTIRFPQKEIQCELVAGVPIRGRMLLDGEPMTGVDVRLDEVRPSFAFDPKLWVSTARTNAKGEYALYAPDPNHSDNRGAFKYYFVRLVAPPAFTQSSRLTRIPLDRSKANQDGVTVRDIEIQTATGVAGGTVVDDQGQPVIGATIRVNNNECFGDPDRQGNATTNELGEFRWNGLGKGKFRPLVRWGNTSSLPDVNLEAGQQNVKIVVSRP